MTIRATSTVCAVIGNPVRHSLSPEIHNAAYRELGLDFVYVACEVEDVCAAMAGMRGLGLRGLSVTIPHKQAVMPYLDQIDPEAQRVGAVNTIVNDGGQLTGYCTDGVGALAAVRDSGLDPEGLEIVLLGNGGSARAIAAALTSSCQPAQLHLVARNTQRAATLAADLATDARCPIAVADLHAAATRDLIARCQLVINTTPMGMHPHAEASPLPIEWLHAGLTVFDIVYTPRETLLLRQAETQGAHIIHGLEMLLHQAVEQFRMFTGQPAPLAVMRSALEAGLDARDRSS